MKRYGVLTRQILELLATGVLLGFVRDRKERRRLLEECDHIWYSIDRKQLYVILDRLRLQRAIEVIKRGDREEIRLSNIGRAKTLDHQFQNLVLSPKRRWDGKWRIVFFDIPELRRKIRDALRRKLKMLGFLEFQKSVFVYPYPCRDEINFVINFFDIAGSVYYIEAPIIPDRVLRNHFKP